MKVSISIAAVVAAASLYVEHASAATVCKFLDGGKGFELRKGSSSTLCYNNKKRIVDFYDWPGFEKPDHGKVKKIKPEEDATGSSINPTCDHVFELTFLMTYLNEHVCSILESTKGKNFDTEEKKKSHLITLQTTINDPSNVRLLEKSLEQKFKTPNVASFVKSGSLVVKAGTERNDNIALAALNNYLSQTRAEATSVAAKLDTEVGALLELLKADGAAIPAKPDFSGKWKRFVSAMNKQGQKAVKAISKDAPAVDQGKGGGKPKGKRNLNRLYLERGLGGEGEYYI